MHHRGDGPRAPPGLGLASRRERTPDLGVPGGVVSALTRILGGSRPVLGILDLIDGGLDCPPDMLAPALRRTRPSDPGSPGLGIVTSAVATLDGKGYWVLLSDGEVFPSGDAANLGSPSSSNFNALNVGDAIFATSDGAGYGPRPRSAASSTTGTPPMTGHVHLSLPPSGATDHGSEYT